tara:strand:+ start:1600 stop:1863 length:264 start_codon:yes stop_codon:yes gene_type:complete
MANIFAISYHSGGTVHEMESNTPASIAQTWDLSLDGVKIFVNESEATATQDLRDGDYVSFQKSKVESGATSIDVVLSGKAVNLAKGA